MAESRLSSSSSSRWSFNARQQLCGQVSQLPPACLSDVVHIIFGHTTEIVTGDEFTVDFAKLDDKVCLQLENYLSCQGMGPTRQVTAQEIEPNHCNDGDEDEEDERAVSALFREELHGPSQHTHHEHKKKRRAPATSTKEKKRRTTNNGNDDSASPKRPKPEREPVEVNRAIVKEVRGTLAWCRVKERDTDCAYSVVACRGKLYLLLSDTHLSLEWSSLKELEVMEGEDTSFDLRATAEDCSSVLAWLRQLDVVEPFAQPMDSRSAPAYAIMVDQPMDLMLIESKLRDGGYATTGGAGFAADIRLVHSNAVAYSEHGHSADPAIYRAAQVFISAFQGRWQRSLRAKSNPADLCTFQKRHAGAMPESTAAGSATLGPSSLSTAHADHPESLIGQRIDIYWQRDDLWYSGLVGEFRRRDSRFRVDYDDGQTEWIDLSKERFRIIGPGSPRAAVPGSSSGSSAKKQRRANISRSKAAGNEAFISVQKLGILVWAKSGTHPWWPAELCLPAADCFVESLPPPSKLDKRRKKHFVFYFGETQYDILDVTNVLPFDAKPKPSRKDKTLLKAYDLAAQRLKTLGDAPRIATLLSASETSSAAPARDHHPTSAAALDPLLDA